MLEQKDFEQLYQQFFSDLMRVVFGITYDREIAEDVCQEAFIRLYHKLHLFPTSQDAKYWLIRVAKNLSFNYCKRKKNERKAVEKVKRQPMVQVKTGEDLLIERETKDLVRKALDQLSPKYKQILVLKEYSGLSYREIAKVVGISDSNVKVRAFRARAQLEKILKQEDEYVSK